MVECLAEVLVFGVDLKDAFENPLLLLLIQLSLWGVGFHRWYYMD